MGLTVHYSLKLRDEQTNPREILQKLREQALELPVVNVTEIREFSPEEIEAEGAKGSDSRWFWLIVQSEIFVRIYMQPERGSYKTKGYMEWRVSPIKLIGFIINVGVGCEPMCIGFAQYPEKYTRGGIHDESWQLWSYKERTKTIPGGWQLSAFIKTQYASMEQCGGMSHFERCHKSVIKMLDAAKKLKALRSVDDESDYFKSRDSHALIRTCAEWNAGIAGMRALSHALSGDSDTQCPLDNEPDLEMMTKIGRFNNAELDAVLEKIG